MSARGNDALTAAHPRKSAWVSAHAGSGKTYTLGFAIHDDYTSHRFHDVSLATTMVLDSGAAEIVAVKK